MTFASTPKKFVDPFGDMGAPITAQQQPQENTQEAPSRNFIDPYANTVNNAPAQTENQEGYFASSGRRERENINKIIDELKAIPDGVLTGLADQSLGLNQIVLAGLNKLGLVSDDKYKTAVKEYQQVVDSGPLFTSKENYENSDVGRTVGEIGSYITPGALYTKAPSLIKSGTAAAAKAVPALERLAKFGAKPGVGYAEAGAIGANLQVVPEGESRVADTIYGGLAGYGAGKVIEKILGNRAAKKALEDAAEAKPAALDAEAKLAASDDAVKISKEATPNAPLFAEPEFRYNAQNKPSPQLTFANEADDLGIRYSKGDASQDFKQQEFESRAAKMQDIGDDLRTFRQEQQGDIITAGRTFNEGIGGTQSKTAAGANVQKALREGEKTARQEVSDIYERAKAASGNDAPVPYSGIRSTYDDVINDFEDVIPSPIIKKFNEFGIGTTENATKQLTVENAEKLIKSINVRIGATNDPATKLGLSKLKNAVDEAVDSLGQADDEAASLFTQGRAKRTELGETFQQSDIVEQVVSKKAKFTDVVSPQKVVDKIIKDPARNLENIPKVKNALVKSGPSGVKAWNDLRAATMSDLIENSVRGADTGQPYFDVVRFNKEASKIGDDALKMMLTEKEFTDFKKFQRVVTQIHRKQPGVVNNSNTATSLVNMLSSSPLLNGYFGGFLKSMSRKVTKYRDIGQVNEAIKGGKRPTESAVRAAADDAITRNSPLIKLLSIGAGKAVSDKVLDKKEQGNISQ